MGERSNPQIDHAKVLAAVEPIYHFRRTLEMLLINFEINFILTWSENHIVYSATGETQFAMTNTTLYVPVVALSIQNNAKLL